MFQPLLHQFTLIIGQGKGLYFTDNGQHPAFGKLVSRLVRVAVFILCSVH